MSKFDLSNIELPVKSKSMSFHIPEEDNTNISIKQIGDYILGEEIGSGAFGKVLLGKHTLTEEKVAIKVLDKILLNQTPEDYELVKKEISILKLVKHRYIVQLYEILQTAQHIFIIMEYCEGKEILDYILTKNRLSELEGLKYFQQLINCLFYLHSQNIAHRDVKIDNMLLDKNRDLKLIDFGLSTKYSDDDLLDQPCGTVVYAAPEVLEGKEYHGMLADVWSSGIVLYGMLAGYLPFSDKDDEVNKKQVIKGEVNIPDFFSDKAKDLLKHMLDVNPMTRYTLQEIKDHPWFNLEESALIPGIIIGYNIIPIDDKIIDLCVTYNKDKNDVINSIKNNKHDSNSALYYLLVKNLEKKGVESISDMCSEQFIDFVLDENNLINTQKSKEENNDNKEEERKSAIKNKNEKCEDIIKINNTNEIIEENKKQDELKNIDSNTNKKINERNNNISNELQDNCIDSIKGEKLINSHLNEINNKPFEEFSNSEIKDNSPIIQKNYDMDEADIIKENKFENNEEKNKEFFDKNENKDNTKLKIDNNERISLLEEIILDDEKRFNTEIINNDIAEKILNISEINIDNDNIKKENIDIVNEMPQNIQKLEQNNSQMKENKEKNIKEHEEHSDINNSNHEIIKESKLNIKNEDNIIEKAKESEKINNEQINKDIKNLKNIDDKIFKDEKILSQEKEKGKQKNLKKDKIKTTNKNLFLTTKKKLYFDEKSNIVSKRVKKNAAKPKNPNIISSSKELKTEKIQSISKKLNKNRINNKLDKKTAKNKNSKYNNYSTRNSENKYNLIKNRINQNNILVDRNNFSNVKIKPNKIYNIINIINNNFNSPESEYKIKNNYQSPLKNKENLNLNITNLKNKFDEFAIINNNNNNKNIYDNIISYPNLNDNKRNIFHSNNKYENSKTNNITIIIQNKKVIKNNDLFKSLINFDNKNIINSSNSKNKKIFINNKDNSCKNNLKRKNLESSVIVKRYKSPLSIRELSESPKQKYLNRKTRLTKIPWKLKKKGLDSKMDSKQILNKYKNKMKNPFDQYNSKIVNNLNIKSNKNSECNSIRNSLYHTIRENKPAFSHFSKKVQENNNDKISDNIKQNKLSNNIIKNEGIQFKKKDKNSKDQFFSVHSKNKNNISKCNESPKIESNKKFNLFSRTNFKIKNVNSLFSMNNILTNINDNKKSFLNVNRINDKLSLKENDIKDNNKKHKHNYSINNALSINLKNKFIKSENDENNNPYIPINLSCLFFKNNDITEYKNILKNKMKKNSISFIQKKENCFNCRKNGYHCEIKIIQIKLTNINHNFLSQNDEGKINENQFKNLYYIKMFGKRESFGINNFFKKFALNLN